MNSTRRSDATSQHTRDLLESKDYVNLVGLCQTDKKYFKALKFAVYYADDAISRPAVEVVGRLMYDWWRQGEQGKVREYIRSLLWSLNDESGGIGWNSPQQLAEIIVRIPGLADPYINIMIDRCLGELLLVENAMWAVGRMGKLSAGAVQFFSEDILKIFGLEEPQILATSAWAMGEVGFAPAIPCLRLLKTGNEPARIYIDGKFIEKTVGDWVSVALKKLGPI